jgi:hypothetical protein
MFNKGLGGINEKMLAAISDSFKWLRRSILFIVTVFIGPKLRRSYLLIKEAPMEPEFCAFKGTINRRLLRSRSTFQFGYPTYSNI